jgi:hypothetical protein
MLPIASGVLPFPTRNFKGIPPLASGPVPKMIMICKSKISQFKIGQLDATAKMAYLSHSSSSLTTI